MFVQVVAGLQYQISAFLFDPKTTQMFGRQCQTAWKTADNNDVCVFDEVRTVTVSK